MLRNLGYVVAVACGSHCVSHHIADLVWLEGPSMQTTIHDGELVINSKRSTIRRGDIVTARSPNNPKQLICKRVVGLSGDKIENPTKQFSRKCVPKGYMWLEGDNKKESLDSRTYGPIPAALAEGKVVFRLWPPSRFGAIDTENRHQRQTLVLRFHEESLPYR